MLRATGVVLILAALSIGAKAVSAASIDSGMLLSLATGVLLVAGGVMVARGN